MNDEQLHYFELAYRERNYSAAARLVPCTPQGLAKAIHSLEKELSVTLFTTDEATGMPAPTEYAHELYEFACVSDGNRRLLSESFDRIRGKEHFRLRLGCSLGVLGVFGPDFLSGFRQLHPNTELQRWETDEAFCELGVRKGDFDLGLLVGPFSDDLVATELYRCPVYYWMLADDPLAQKTSLSIEDFAGRNVAMPGEGFKCYERLRSESAAAGVKLGEVFEMSEIFQTYEFAASGKGLGFTVRHIRDLGSFTNRPDVVSVPMSGAPWHFGVVRLATHVMGEAELAFWNWCTSYAKRLPSDPID
jgi:DNA-binding transcriptional LysR family regulator